MNVQVKHNGTAITGYVISYNREHKICTGIGTLQVELVRTIPRTFVPWDEIDIWENGSFKVKYYVSSVQDLEPKGTLLLDCQDISKRLVDYFIPDSYTVDYPSYTRYWIEKFLTEAGVAYQFTTSSQGTLLSNFTQLGLVTTYEQLQTLLQMSGWYMYFSGDEKAVIGSLDINTVTGSYTVGKTDILNILKESNDKMLRNRALILGAFDPFRGGYASADVTVHTPWNYDHRDIRSVVISNSNIPNSGTAYGMANQIIKEFARITVEKHITIWGARNYNLGRAMRVSSNVWRGRGLITTFGVELSKDGLVTHVVLDERCPRLFGYFDWGDYVYVGTFGDGVWRKHIKFDHTWHNFSDGLTNLNITDLHINNGVFGAVGSSGQMYYAIDDVPWHPIDAPVSLLSSADGTVSSGDATMTSFSGMVARAVIVDKLGNVVRFGVDNASGINYGDYFLNMSGWLHSVSGVMGSGTRGWIVEYDVLNGDTVGTSFPISLSGVYNFAVLDLDNDGKNDYVSVATIGSGTFIPFVNGGYNFGLHTSSPFNTTHDSRSLLSYTFDSNLDLEGQSLITGLGSGVEALSVFENESAGEREVVIYNSSAGVRTMKRFKYTKPFDPTINRERVTVTILTSPSTGGSISADGICKMSDTSYRLYHHIDTSDANNFYFSVYYKTWTTSPASVSGDTLVGTLTVPKDLPKGIRFSVSSSYRTINDTIHFLANATGRAQSGISSDVTNYVKIYRMTIPMTSGATTLNGLVFTQNYTSSTGDGVTNWNINFWGGGGIRQNGDTISYTQGYREWNDTISTSATILRNYIISSQDGINFQNTQVQSATTSTDADFIVINDVGGEPGAGYNQLTDTDKIWYIHHDGKDRTLVFNGTSAQLLTQTDVPTHWRATNIKEVFGGSSHKYVALLSGTYYFVNAHTYAIESSITFPANYTVGKIVNSAHTYSEMYFWTARNNTTTKYEVLRTNTASVLSSIVPFSNANLNTGTRAFMTGNFLIDVSGGSVQALYLNNTNIGGTGTKYQVLRRDGADFTLIEEESYPIRIDISNSAPVLAVGSGEGSFVSNYVYEGSLVVVEQATASGGRPVEDYRYCFLEPTLQGVVTSGAAGLQTILYVQGSGVYGADALTYSGGFSVIYQVPSGYGTRIETSTYGVGGQYVFITSSGFVQTFYQKDPGQVAFVPYSGMPQSRATIIRLDDAV